MRRNELLNCDSFEDRIHQILDDRLTLTGDDLLMEHAASCTKCEQVLNDYDSVDDSVKLLKEELNQIWNKSEQHRDRNGRPTFASRSLIVLASLAAIIVISLNVFDGISLAPQPSSQQAALPVASSSQIAIVSPGLSVRHVSARENKSRRTPDTSPFSPNFSVANSIPNMSLPKVPSWDDISKSLDPLEPVFNYSIRFPAVQPVHCSLNVTIDWLRKSLSDGEQEDSPDLGFAIDPELLAAV